MSSMIAHLVVALFERLLSKSISTLRSVHRCRHFKSNVQVPALDDKIKSRFLVFHKVQCDLFKQKHVNHSLFPSEKMRVDYLWEPFLLEIGDDTLADEVRSLNNVKHLFVVITQERKLESILRWINGDRSWTCRTVEAMHNWSLNSSKIDRVVQGTNDTGIAIDCVN